jgi:hypothetical protein
MADQTEIEVVDAEVVELEPRSSAQLAQTTATQAALVAAGGIAAGIATVAAFKRRRTVRAAKRSRKVAVGEVVASRRFLVDVHVLRN